jgi:hypothetical protein
MNTPHDHRALPLLLGLLLAGCRERYELTIERTEEDAERSCTAICYDAVTSVETQDDEHADPDLLSCEDLEDVDGRDMVACRFLVLE